MDNFKLTIELLPKGAWNNDFSRTLPKKEWDIIRSNCYKKVSINVKFVESRRMIWTLMRFGSLMLKTKLKY